MNDLATHIALFVAVGVAIVTLGVFYSEADDAAAFKTLPRRLAGFFGGCAVLIVVMLLCEHTFAALG